MFRRSFNSDLFDQITFYKALEGDLLRARREVIIESPFITTARMVEMMPIIQRLMHRGVTVYINTRHPDEHRGDYRAQAMIAIEALMDIGVTVLYTGRLHRKLAIIDREVFYEGSLNILSYRDSCEIMRRVASSTKASKLLEFIGLSKYVG